VEILNLIANSTPLSTSYESDADVNFIGNTIITEEGIKIYAEEYLKETADSKINNYSSIYLTKKQKATDIIEIQTLKNETTVEIFNTSISDNNSGLYLTISGLGISSSLPYFFTEKNEKFIDPIDCIFEVTLLDANSAKIIHRNKNRSNYYLAYDGEIKFINTDNSDKNIFNYVLDRDNQKLSLFKRINNVVNVIGVDNSTKFYLTSTLSTFKANHFNVNYYLRDIKPKLNSSWVSYEPRGKNSYLVNSKKSRLDLENNFLISTQYSNLTGDKLSSNILNLKNQFSNKNYSYRSNYLEKTDSDIPVVDNRNYVGLFTGNRQEKGDHAISLSYEFYNTDYKFVADRYTTFITPKSLYPYKQININDLEWNNRGSIAGENPYTSDKIFTKRIKNGINGEYLCSWLRKEKDGKSIWLDRYYYPEKTSYASALSSTFAFKYEDNINQILAKKLETQEYYDIPYLYNSLEEELKHTPQRVSDVVYGYNYFDKRSDLIISPDTEYIYHRIGNDYVKQIMETVKDVLITEKLTLLNGKNAEILITDSIDDIEYDLNGNARARIENYNDINSTHQFTICFWLQNDNWKEKIGHQLFGNLNDRGFGFLDDQKITPLITVQNNKGVYIYNTNFELLDIASLENENKLTSQTNIIKDLYRTDHLDSFYTINID
jgi:hypothetical protein